LENLLIWARSQMDDFELNPVTFNLRDCVSESIGFIKSQASGKNITVKSMVSGDFIVNADRNMICTVVRNLLGNAIKFTPLNGAINVNITLINENYEISVTDSGVGIKSDDLVKLFRIDHKLSTPGTENEKGTGLGLILCKQFVEKHGGKIWVESEVGAGSRFVFTLPQ